MVSVSRRTDKSIIMTVRIVLLSSVRTYARTLAKDYVRILLFLSFN